MNKKINKLSIGFVVRIMERSKIAVFTVFSLIVSRLVYGTHCVYCLCQLKLSCTQMRGDITWACNDIQDGHKKSACLQEKWYPSNPKWKKWIVYSCVLGVDVMNWSLRTSSAACVTYAYTFAIHTLNNIIGNESVHLFLPNVFISHTLFNWLVNLSSFINKLPIR